MGAQQGLILPSLLDAPDREGVALGVPADRPLDVARLLPLKFGNFIYVEVLNRWARAGCFIRMSIT